MIIKRFRGAGGGARRAMASAGRAKSKIDEGSEGNPNADDEEKGYSEERTRGVRQRH